MASLRQQYGLRVQSDEFAGMGWDEFSDLIAGLSDDTPLAKVARIRTEDDPEAIKQMTPGQRRMRAEWQRERALRRSEGEGREFLAAIQGALARAFGDSGEEGS